MNNTIKELVKKHFNLVEATEQSFGEIKTADGELTLSYEGDALAQGLAIFVVTADGNIPAPDGEHMLEGDITIVTADGKIEAIKETEAPAEELEEEEIVSEEMAEHGDEEEKMEEALGVLAVLLQERRAGPVGEPAARRQGLEGRQGLLHTVLAHPVPGDLDQGARQMLHA